MKLIGVKDLCEFLNVKKSTVYVWANNGILPCYRLNGLLRFDLGEIVEWVKGSKVAVPNMRTLPQKAPENQEIDTLLKEAIEKVKGKGYNRPQRGSQTNQAGKGGKIGTF